ncbi:unnamed protein product, partial [Laminaria digitata]
MNIRGLLQLEEELKSATAPSLERDAKVNLLKYLQVQTVQYYGVAWDGLFYELNKRVGLECLRNIKPVRSEIDFLQPKVYNLQDLYLADAERAKLCLDELIKKVVENLEGCEALYAEVKSRESTVRKANKSYDGDVRRVADMARVTVVCETPDLLVQVYLCIMGQLQPEDVLRVGNGFDPDWMPGGYRDVKVNPIVNGHLCEIQLQLRAFFSLKDGQHAAYRWARELKVTKEIMPYHLFENLSGEVTQEMIRLAQQNWRGTKDSLPCLYIAAGDYLHAQEILNKKVLSLGENIVLCAEEHSEEWRQAAIAAASVSGDLGNMLADQGKYAESEALCRRSLSIREKTLGQEHPHVATSLGNLGVLLQRQGKNDEAEPLLRRSLAAQEKALGSEHPDVAQSLLYLASLSEDQGKYAESETLHRRSLAIREKVLGSEHPDVAASHDHLASALESQVR